MMGAIGGIVGQLWERRAEWYLRQQGLTVVMRNFRCRLGEIDLIMREAQVLCFIEVRYRGESRFGSGLESISPAKVRKLVAASQLFLTAHPRFANSVCRFDVISLNSMHSDGIQWTRQAFDAH